MFATCNHYRQIQNPTIMKKIFVVLAVAALCASCQNVDKCKCKIETENLTIKQTTVYKPEEKKCSEIKIEDVKSGLIDINFSKIGKISCVPFHE